MPCLHINRGKRGRKGGVPFPGGTEGGVTLPLCPFLAEEGEGRKGGAKRREGSRVIWGEERRCTRNALLTHIFPYLYFIYSTHIEDEKF